MKFMIIVLVCQFMLSIEHQLSQAAEIDTKEVDSCQVKNVREMLQSIWKKYLNDELSIEQPRRFTDELLRHNEADKRRRAEGVIAYFLAQHCDQSESGDDYKLLQPPKWMIYIEGQSIDEELMKEAQRLDEIHRKGETVDDEVREKFEANVNLIMGFGEDEIAFAVEKLDF